MKYEPQHTIETYRSSLDRQWRFLKWAVLAAAVVLGFSVVFG